MRALIDANVVLDVLLNRAPWVADSTAVWEANCQRRLHGHVVATTVTNLFYIARRRVGQPLALRGVRDCLAAFDVVSVDGATLNDAADLPGSDYEDNVMICCAMLARMDVIVTRDARGFGQSPVPVMSPAELITHLPST